MIVKHFCNFFSQKFKNQAFTTTFKSGFKHQLKKVEAYSQDYISNEFELPAYNLKSKINLDIKKQVYLKPEYLSLLTYNIWFSAYNIKNRYDCILKMLAKSDADIICLQEVNDNFMSLLQDCQIRKKFDYFVPVMKMHRYDTLILSKYPCKFYKKHFTNSAMERSNLIALIQFAQDSTESTFKLGINCIHLQSQRPEEKRIEQIQQIISMNTGMDMSIIAGDFNFSDGSKEDKLIQYYIDVWKTGMRTLSKFATQKLRRKGYTLPQISQFTSSKRTDRIIYKGKENVSKNNTNEIAIIGDFTIPPYEQDHFTKVANDGKIRTPSDHFGLISKIYL